MRFPDIDYHLIVIICADTWELDMSDSVHICMQLIACVNLLTLLPRSACLCICSFNSPSMPRCIPGLVQILLPAALSFNTSDFHRSKHSSDQGLTSKARKGAGELPPALAGNVLATQACALACMCSDMPNALATYKHAVASFCSSVCSFYSLFPLLCMKPATLMKRTLPYCQQLFA